jgi:hypothetical protein
MQSPKPQPTREQLEKVKELMEKLQADKPPSALDELRQIDPERYKRLAAPFDDEDEFNQALKGFFKELGVLREKYAIPDVFVAAMGFVRNGEHLVEQRMSTMHYGDTSLRPFIILNLYRQEHPMLQALIRGMSGAPTDGP